MQEEDNTSADSPTQGAAVDAGNYEVIKGRLVAHGEAVAKAAATLNAARTEAFGSSALEVQAQGRVRTEHNCLPCDILHVGGHLLFGYNVRIGLKQEVSVGDVFSLHAFASTPEGVEFPVADLAAAAGGFLADPAFEKDFADLYKYYRETRLEQLRAVNGKVLAVFRYGKGERDLRVFRWNVLPDGRLAYVDNRGERDHVFAESHAFDWTPTTRDDHVDGRHPHVSIFDEVFVETVGGDLTVKIENNTEDGLGIYREPVDDAKQTLDDARIEYARVGGLIALKIRPYNEEAWRYLVYNPRTKEVRRIDAIGEACLELPEDHGIIFPGGYYLRSGDHKIFGAAYDGLEFHSQTRSPNGEDVLYVFYHPGSGRYLLLPYNLIRKEVQNQIACHGYSLFDDGRLVVFRAEDPEPSRVHPMQVWETPFLSQDAAAAAPTDDTFYGRIGNAELVRGVSEALSIVRMIDDATPTRQLYEDLIGATRRMLDNFYWLDSSEGVPLRDALRSVLGSAELIVDEFDKVVALRKQAAEVLREVGGRQVEAVEHVLPDSIATVEGFMDALGGLRAHRGHLITVREVRYIDLAKLDAYEAATVERFDEVSRACVTYLLGDEALAPLRGALEAHLAAVDGIEKTADADALRAEVDGVANGLEVLSEVVAGIDVDDPTQRTQILEGISEVFAHANRVRATVAARRKEIAVREGRAEFAAQFTLFGQAVQSALSLADTPEKCDEQLSRLLLQLEELETRFSELDEYLADLATKREEVVDAFDARRQGLLDERQRRVGSLVTAAGRIVEGITRRAGTLNEPDRLNAFFAADPMVMKLRQVAEQLRALGDSVKADEVESRLKSARQDAARGLRDRVDLFEDGANIIRLGRHRFSVNTQPLDLSVVPHDGGMAFHLSGTDFFDAVDDPEFADTRAFWSQQLVSETAEVYRGEYLAATLLFAAEAGEEGLSLPALAEAERSEGGLLTLVRERAAERYDEGYERGVHDVDAAAILAKLLHLRSHAGLLRFDAGSRALACLFWAQRGADADDGWALRARNLAGVREVFGDASGVARLAADLEEAIAAWRDEVWRGAPSPGAVDDAAAYLVEELMSPEPRFVLSGVAAPVVEKVRSAFRDRSGEEPAAALDALAGKPRAQLELALAWTRAAAGPDDEAAAVEAAVALVCGPRLEREANSAQVEATVDGLLGQHPRIADQRMRVRLDSFQARLRAFVRERVPAYQAYRARRQALVEAERERLRIAEFMPRVMSSFVRNKLINDVYLPLIGDNLAKQLGGVGEGKRTDLMGLLLLISPPGYGKTTLMEYVASRLGLVFMKVNGPSLGHSVTSLDPAEAPNATARQEVEKVNLALEMGNNVMLYLDDIQHTHPEFLQKFISLCDATRRIEGVWNGKTRTYDLRGKKFAVVMAGNPYTEAGEKFQIPDMLANRADTYNLGEVLEGEGGAFALSYVENALTSNPVLAPLAARGMDDVYRAVDLAMGKEVATTDFDHNYSAVELQEIVAVLKHMMAARDLLLAVNAEYIRSAAQSDAYRTEPRFQLQGSYRNMNKIAEKLVSAMTPEEVQALLTDHYAGESQTLTSGAEQNLLKLAELRGRMTPEQAERWANIKAEFGRRKLMGDDDDDPIARVTGTLAGLVDGVGGIRQTIADAAVSARPEAGPAAWVGPLMARLDAISEGLQRPVPDPGASITPVLRNIDARLAAAHQRQKTRGASQRADADALAAAVEKLGAGSGQPDPRLSQALDRLNATLASGTARPTASSGAADAAALERIDATLRLVAQQQQVVRELVASLAAAPRAAAQPATKKLPALAPEPRPATPSTSAPAVTNPAVAKPVARPVSGNDTSREDAAEIVREVSEMFYPLLNATRDQASEGRAVNARMVELLDVLKLYIQHLHRMDER